jgi:hypothetical protein
MTPTSTDDLTQKKLVRESLEIKDDEELLLVYALRDTDEWTETAYKTAREILLKRGYTPDELESVVPGDENDELESEETGNGEIVPPLHLEAIDWQNDALEVIYKELSKRTLILRDKMTSLSEVMNLIPGKIQIIDSFDACKYIPESNTFLPINELGNTIESQPDDEDEESELLAELRDMGTADLIAMWFESDPMEWNRSEISDLRQVFRERGMIPMYLFDAPADLVQRLPYLNEESLSLRGWPGFRIRPGRTGYDYLDYPAEEAHLEGMFVRYLFTCKLRTTNPVYIILMALLGLACLPVMAAFATESYLLGFLFLPMVIVGVFLLINVAYSIQDVCSLKKVKYDFPPFWPPY